MSNKAMNHVWEQSNQKGNALLVLLAIADMADDHMVCYPGKGHLAKKCRLGIRAIKAIIDKLQEAGEIQIYHRRTGVRNATNVYRIVMPSIGDRVMNRGASIGDRVMNGDSLPEESGFLTPEESGFLTLRNRDSSKPSYNPKKESIEKQKPLTPFDILLSKDEEL